MDQPMKSEILHWDFSEIMYTSIISDINDSDSSSVDSQFFKFLKTTTYGSSGRSVRFVLYYKISIKKQIHSEPVISQD